MEIQRLRCFMAVQETGSFSAAAKRLRCSQPTVSQHIKLLEEELDTELFERIGTRQVRSTRAGKLLMELATPLLGDFERLATAFAERLATEREQTTITLATDATSLRYLLVPALHKLQQSYPSVTCRVELQPAEQIISQLLSGEADIGLSTITKATPGLHQQRLGPYARVLLTDRGHPLALAKQPISLATIATYPVILTESPDNFDQVVVDAFAKASEPLPKKILCNDVETAKAYVKIGSGVAIVNSYHLGTEDLLELSSVDVSHLFGRSEKTLLTRKGRKLHLASKYLMLTLTRSHL